MKVTGKKNDNRGVATILVIGVIGVFLIFFLVIAIDFAFIYVVRGQIQNSADAASLAGVVKLTPAIDDSLANLVQEEAREEAWEFACKNYAAGARVYLGGGLGNACNNPPPLGDLNDSNAPGGDIVVGNWDDDTRVFTPGDGTTDLPINAVKVVARRTESSPGGPVGLFFGRLVDWPEMAVSQVAIAAKKPPYLAPLPICLPSCDLLTPLKVEWGYDKTHDNNPPATPPNNPIYCTDSQLPPGNGGTNSDELIPPSSTPGQVMQLGPSTQAANVKMPGLAWTNFNVEDCNVRPACNMPNPGEVRPYITGERTPPDICGKNICTTNGSMQTVLGHNSDVPGDPTLRGQFLQNREIVNVGGIDINGWLVLAPIVSDLSCGDPTQPCPGAQAGAANPYEVLGFAQVLVTDVVTTGSAKGIRIVGLSNPRDVTLNFTCKQGNADLIKTITRNVTSITCVDCGDPLPYAGSRRARLVK